MTEASSRERGPTGTPNGSAPSPSQIARASALIAEARTLAQRGDVARADELLREALELRERELGPNHPLLLQTLHDFANLWIARGELTRAEPFLRRALELVEASLGSDHSSVPVYLSNLAQLHLKRGTVSLAAPLLSRLYTIRRTTTGDRLELANVGENLGAVRHALGEYDEALRLRREVLAIRIAALGELHPGTGTALEALAETRAALGDREESLQLTTRALRVWEERGDSGRIAVAQGRLVEYQLGLHSTTPLAMEALLREPLPSVAPTIAPPVPPTVAPTPPVATPAPVPAAAPIAAVQPSAAPVAQAAIVPATTDERVAPPVARVPLAESPRTAGVSRFLPAPAREPEAMDTPAFGSEVIRARAEAPRPAARAPQTTTSMIDLLAPVIASMERAPARPNRAQAVAERAATLVRQSVTGLQGIARRGAAAVRSPASAGAAATGGVVARAMRATPVASRDADDEFFRSPLVSWKTAQIALVVLSIGTAIAFGALAISDRHENAALARDARSAVAPSLIGDPSTLAASSARGSAPIVDSALGALRIPVPAVDSITIARNPAQSAAPAPAAMPAPVATPPATKSAPAATSSSRPSNDASSPRRRDDSRGSARAAAKTAAPVEDSLRPPPPAIVIPSLDTLVRVKTAPDSQPVKPAP